MCNYDRKVSMDIFILRVRTFLVNYDSFFWRKISMDTFSSIIVIEKYPWRFFLFFSAHFYLISPVFFLEKYPWILFLPYEHLKSIHGYFLLWKRPFIYLKSNICKYHHHFFIRSLVIMLKWGVFGIEKVDDRGRIHWFYFDLYCFFA